MCVSVMSVMSVMRWSWVLAVPLVYPTYKATKRSSKCVCVCVWVWVCAVCTYRGVLDEGDLVRLRGAGGGGGVDFDRTGPGLEGGTRSGGTFRCVRMWGDHIWSGKRLEYACTSVKNISVHLFSFSSVRCLSSVAHKHRSSLLLFFFSSLVPSSRVPW